ncbi:MAG: hypothetical protein R2788_18465 [Saprospiraceae bacterium]
MKAFEANFVTVIIRFYLMMAVVLIAGFTGIWWLAILALPIFLSSMMCVKFFDKKEDVKHGKPVKMVQMKQERREMKEAI